MLQTLPVLLLALSPPVTQTPMLADMQPRKAAIRRVDAPSTRRTIIGTALAEIAPTKLAELQSFERLIILSETQQHPRAAALLRDYLAFPEGWDGNRGQPAKPRAVEDALFFLGALPGDLPSPTPMIERSGEVGLYWLRGEVYAEAGFDGSRLCYMFAEAPGMEAIHRDDMRLDDPSLYDDLRRALFRQHAEAL